MTSEAYPAKLCRKCERRLSLDAFHRLKRAKDGRQSRCKDCQRKQNREWVRENRERAAVRAREWRAQNPEAWRRYDRAWREANREKARAQKAFGKAVRRGKVVPPSACSSCGKQGPVQGHHTDYTKRLEVVWLCIQCHRDQHPRVLRTVV